jgi:hypothetical protein
MEETNTSSNQAEGQQEPVDVQRLVVIATAAAESAESHMHVAQNRANKADSEQQRASKAAELAEAARNTANTASQEAEEAAAAAKESSLQGKASLNAAIADKQRADQAAEAAEQAKETSEAHALSAKEESELAEQAATEADKHRLSAKERADIAAIEQDRAANAAKAALSAKNMAEANASSADEKLKKLNETLEHAITATLGGAFQQKSERSRKLDFLWLGMLIAGIAGIFCIGYLRYDATAQLISAKAEISYIALQILINLASMSGPIWLSWVATLRLARTHAITEDYSYKAALAQAYQGYSTSVAEEDEFLKYRLFATVITQLDASPVRFVTEKHPATPFQDLMQQPWMEEVLKDETFKGKLVEWLKSKFKTTFKAAASDEG